MFGFLAFVAVANLVLGYALAVYLRGRSGRSKREFFADLLDLTPHVCPVAKNTSHVPTPTHADNQPQPQPGKTRPATSNGDVAPTLAPRGERWASPADLEQQLQSLTAGGDAPTSPASLVLAELDTAELEIGVPEDRLLNGIAHAVQEILAETHSAARRSDQQLMLLLPGDNESIATQRAERLRQRVEATEFLVDGRPTRATVSCALAQLESDSIVHELLATLQETLKEAQRSGGNRTFHFENQTPTPVVPPELNLSSRKCAV